MNPTLHTDARPEAMSDVPGVCELPLTRAVVQYRDVHEIELAGGRIQDIGLGLVLEGRFASSAEVVDLGSADVKLLDLSAELVVLDWVYEPTLEHAASLVRAAAASEDRSELGSFCFRLGLRVLERVGYGALTRPTLLRIGFRDICRDLDLHEGTSVRIVTEGGGVVRAHLDYDSHALLVRTPTSHPDPGLEDALRRAFPRCDLRALVPVSPSSSGGYQLRFPLPLSAPELREQLVEVRSGLVSLLSRFEPERFRSVEAVMDTFGRRQTLDRLRFREPELRSARVEPAERDVSLGGTGAGLEGSTVH